MRRVIGVYVLACALAVSALLLDEDGYDELRAQLLSSQLIALATPMPISNPLDPIGVVTAFSPVPKAVCIAVDGRRDPSPRLMSRLEGLGLPYALVPLSRCTLGRHYAVSKIGRVSGTEKLSAWVSLECGPLCGGGTEFIVARTAEGWETTSGMRWAS